MDWFWSLKLIRLFDFYLVLTFIVSTLIRIRQYRAILNVVRAVPSRWPRLFQLIKSYRRLFLTWGTILPLAVMLGLFLIHTILRRIILSDSTDLTMVAIWTTGYVVPVLVIGIAMVLLDVFLILWVGVVDQIELEEYFDKAEHWLKSWKAPVVKLFTLGYVNPRKMVDDEVRGALVQASGVINRSMWWVSLQAGLRILFGVTLWVAYAHLQT